MTLADDFNIAPHEQKINYLLAVLRDIENLFRYVTADPNSFEKAVKDLQTAYGDESLIPIFIYALQEELRVQALTTMQTFRRAYNLYCTNTPRGRIAGWLMR